MNQQRIALLVLLVVALLITVSACQQQPARSTGPVRLRDAQHMAGFLSHATWRALDTDAMDDVPQFWEFKSDGTFTTWVEDASEGDLAQFISEQIPAGLIRLSGTWQVTTSKLQLSRVITQDGKELDPLELPLNWVDGKLRIEINGRIYMRQW